MRRGLWGLAVAFLFTVALAAPGAARADKSLAHLRAWIGKYPYNESNDKLLWEDPALNKALKATLGSRLMKVLLEDRSVATPIAEKDGVLLSFSCQRHACVLANTYLFIDTRRNTVQACWVASTGGRRDQRKELWLAPGKPPQLLPLWGCTFANDAEAFAAYAQYGKAP